MDNSCLWKGSQVEFSFLVRKFFIEHVLKEQRHEIFCKWFFSWISFPPAPEYPIRTVTNFFENSQRYSQVKVHHRYQRHRWQAAKLPPVSTTPAANFATSFTSVVDTGGKFAAGVNDTGGKQWGQYQAADTLNVNLMQNFIYMVILLSKDVPTKLLKFF